MVLTGETREMQENATPAKEPNFEEEAAFLRPPLFLFRYVEWLAYRRPEFEVLT